MTKLRLDLHHAFRVLIAGRLTTFAAVASLAVGIGGTTAMFTVIDAVLLRTLPFPSANRLVRVWETSPETASRNAAPANFLDWRRDSASFEGLAAAFHSKMTLLAAGQPEQVRVGSVSAEFFDILGVRAVHGRVFQPSEDSRDSGRLVVVGQGFWQRRFGSDPALVGRQIMLGGQPATVIGVIGNVKLDESADFWLLGRNGIPEGAPVPGDQSLIRDAHYITVIGRLNPGAGLEQAQAEMSTIAARLERAHPDTNAHLGVRLEPLQTAIVGETRSRRLVVLLGAVLFLLLIACANVANLLLVRAAGRERELALRQTLGASRGVLVRQMLIESLLLASLGGIIGVSLAAWGVEALLALAPADLPRLDEVALNGRALVFACLTTMATGLLFGVWPAIRASQPELAATLRGSSRATTSFEQRSTMRVLVGAELAIAQVLLVGCGLLLASFLRLTAVAPGFDPHGVLAADVAMAAVKAAAPERKAQFIEQVVERLAAIPDVERAASTLTRPVAGAITRGFRIEGRPAPERQDDGWTAFRTISEDYFAVTSIRVIRGRVFQPGDSAGAEPVAIVNQTFARRNFPGIDPIGRRVALPQKYRRIVGIVADARQEALNTPAIPEVYVPFRQDTEPWNFVSFLVRTSGDPNRLSQAVRQAILAVDPEQPVSETQTLDQALATSLAAQRFTLTLTTIFAGVALLLAAVGTFGVMSHSVSQRTREFGIRIALGARHGEVIRHVLAQSCRLTLCAMAVGLMLGFVAGRAMRELLFEVGPGNPATFAVTAAGLAVVALLASYLPVRRALASDPISSLRIE